MRTRTFSDVDNGRDNVLALVKRVSCTMPSFHYTVHARPGCGACVCMQGPKLGPGSGVIASGHGWRAMVCECRNKKKRLQELSSGLQEGLVRSDKCSHMMRGVRTVGSCMPGWRCAWRTSQCMQALLRWVSTDMWQPPCCQVSEPACSMFMVPVACVWKSPMCLPVHLRACLHRCNAAGRATLWCSRHVPRRMLGYKMC
jgi:hypothetical protein